MEVYTIICYMASEAVTASTEAKNILLWQNRSWETSLKVWLMLEAVFEAVFVVIMEVYTVLCYMASEASTEAKNILP